jgi:hypothetical protein
MASQASLEIVGEAEFALFRHFRSGDGPAKKNKCAKKSHSLLIFENQSLQSPYQIGSCGSINGNPPLPELTTYASRIERL